MNGYVKLRQHQGTVRAQQPIRDEVMNTPNETTIEHDLAWVKQSLTILHKAGFTDTIHHIDMGLSGKMDVIEVAKVVVHNTRHINHPSLDALRKRV